MEKQNISIFDKASWENVNDKIKKQCKGYPNICLLFYGDAGTGKTYTAIAIGKFYKNYKFVKVNDILRDIRSCETAIDEKNMIDDYVYKNHLIIDDLGCEKMSEFAYSIIYEIIDKRILYYPRSLIITTNNNPNKMQDTLSNRIISRLAELCRFIKFTGDDRRLNKSYGIETEITSELIKKDNNNNKEKYENMLKETADNKWR